MIVKQCKSKKYPELSCGQYKDISEFSIKHSLCKECVKLYYKQYDQSHKMERKIKDTNYRDNNKEELKQKRKQKYQLNTQEVKQKSKQYYIKNKQSIKEQRIKNKELKRAQRNEKRKEKYHNDPVFKLKLTISSSIRIAIKNNGGHKNGSILKYLPFSIEQLKQHLEKLFEPWMTWDNWGQYNSNIWDDNDHTTWTWQLDHIQPQSMFQFETMDCEDFLKCWDISNLRPLSAKQNWNDGIYRTRHQ